MSWNCESCGAVVSDKNRACPSCSSAHPQRPGAAAEEQQPLEHRDAEGYTQAERMRRRPLREIADGHLISMRRARAATSRERQRRSGQRDPTPGAVSGPVRTSRPIFFRPMGGGRNR